MMTSFQKLIGALVICLLFLVFAPFSTMAEEPTIGTIIVSVVDEDGETISGNWYLHRGSTASGMLVRNGSFGEKFQMDAGNYFLEVRGQAGGKHPFYLLHSKNPQFLDGGSSITFNVQYFETQEQLLTASGHPPAAQDPALAGTTSQQQNDIIDENGCNSTLGYVWCQRDAECVRFWSPACRVTVSEAVVETEIEAATEPVPAVSEEGESSTLNVPTFDTPPASAEPVDMNVAIESAAGMRLVQTGSSAGLLLIISSMLLAGIVFTGRRYSKSRSGRL